MIENYITLRFLTWPK